LKKISPSRLGPKASSRKKPSVILGAVGQAAPLVPPCVDLPPGLSFFFLSLRTYGYRPGSCSPRGFSVVLGSLLVFDFLHLVGLMAIVLGSCHRGGLGSLLVFDFLHLLSDLRLLSWGPVHRGASQWSWDPCWSSIFFFFSAAES
jgi:hypothetical protein